MATPASRSGSGIPFSYGTPPGSSGSIPSSTSTSTRSTRSSLSSSNPGDKGVPESPPKPKKGFISTVWSWITAQFRWVSDIYHWFRPDNIKINDQLFALRDNLNSAVFDEELYTCLNGWVKKGLQTEWGINLKYEGTFAEALVRPEKTEQCRQCINNFKKVLAPKPLPKPASTT